MEKTMQVLDTHHIAIMTTDVAALAAFYTEKLGFKVTRRWEEPGIVFVDAGSTTLELVPKQIAEGQPGPRGLGEGIGINHIALHVASVDEAAAELEGRGVAITSGPRDFQDIRIAFFTDRDGNVFELVEERGEHKVTT
jgi:catechol 2,3-dioxygenase-like lactoylglutathione lyase family enzyme